MAPIRRVTAGAPDQTIGGFVSEPDAALYWYSVSVFAVGDHVIVYRDGVLLAPWRSP